MTLSDRNIELIQKHQDLLKQDDFEGFYKVHEYSQSETGKFTDFFMVECGINVFDYLDELPRGMFTNSTQKEITIPYKYTILPKNLFYGSNVSKLHLHDNIEELAVGAFHYAHTLPKVTIPDKVEIIPEFCFANALKLKEIELPKNLKEIQNYAFLGCSSLEKIVIPEGVKHLGINLFEECISLKEVILPKSIKYIPKETFLLCPSEVIITTYKHGSNTKEWYANEGILI